MITFIGLFIIFIIAMAALISFLEFRDGLNEIKRKTQK